MLVSLSSWTVCYGWWVCRSNSENNRDKHNLNLMCNKFFCSVHYQDTASHVNTIADPNMLHGDGSAKCIYEWKSKRYKMKNDTASKNFFDCITTSGIVYLHCHLPNVVYLKTFCRYSPQYVVEIGQKINERFSWHKTSFKNSRKYFLHYLETLLEFLYAMSIN